MEEAVTRKFVHEESSSVTSLCAAVESCLSQGLRRRALGLFKTSSSTALLHKVAKTFEPAAVISKLVEQVENSDPTRLVQYFFAIRSYLQEWTYTGMSDKHAIRDVSGDVTRTLFLLSNFKLCQFMANRAP